MISSWRGIVFEFCSTCSRLVAFIFSAPLGLDEFLNKVLSQCQHFQKHTSTICFHLQLNPETWFSQNVSPAFAILGQMAGRPVIQDCHPVEKGWLYKTPKVTEEQTDTNTPFTQHNRAVGGCSMMFPSGGVKLIQTKSWFLPEKTEPFPAGINH